MIKMVLICGIYWWIILLYLLCNQNDVSAIRWLALNHAKHPWNDSHHCPQSRNERKKFGLVGSQTRLCKRLPDLMPFIMKAAADSKVVCQALFADRRWNCTTVSYAPKLTTDLTKGTREQAYVYALSAAAITHSVAKACSSGLISFCPCGHLPNDAPGEFKWKGCSDNVEYGKQVSREWADAPWRRKKRKNEKRDLQWADDDVTSRRNKRNIGKRDLLRSGRFAAINNEDNSHLAPRPRMNQHNNDVGRHLTAQTVETKCKCHGVSGSCTLKMCWKVLPPLPKIGSLLQDKYARATEVRTFNPTTTRNANFESVALMGKVTNDDLIYIRKSPDYCTEDRRVGSLGTRGRFCNASERSHAGCDSMCCGRGYETTEQEIVYSCECRYIHCCYVECKKCRETVEKHFCK